MALDFFRQVAGDVAARGSRLLTGDGAAYDDAQRQAREEDERRTQEEERRKQQEEAQRLFQERLQQERDGEARRRQQAEQARSWFDQALQSARQVKDEAGEALGAARENVQQAASTVGQASSDLGTAARERVDQAGQAKDAAADVIKGNYGAGDRWLAQDPDQPTDWERGTAEAIKQRQAQIEDLQKSPTGEDFRTWANRPETRSSEILPELGERAWAAGMGVPQALQRTALDVENQARRALTAKEAPLRERIGTGVQAALGPLQTLQNIGEETATAFSGDETVGAVAGIAASAPTRLGWAENYERMLPVAKTVLTQGPRAARAIHGTYETARAGLTAAGGLGVGGLMGAVGARGEPEEIPGLGVRRPGEFTSPTARGLSGFGQGQDIGSGIVGPLTAFGGQQAGRVLRNREAIADAASDAVRRFHADERGTAGGTPPPPPTPPRAEPAAPEPRPGGRAELQRAMNDAVAEGRRLGIDVRRPPAEGAPPEHAEAHQRFLDARDAMAGRSQAQDARRAEQRASEEASRAPLVERRAAEAGRGLEGVERRVAEEAAAPGPVTRTTAGGQPIRLFSQLDRALDDPRVQEAAQAGDPRMVLRRLKEAGVTDEELRWTGTDDLAQRTDPITLDELRGHVQQNRAEVREIALGTPPERVQAVRDAQVAAADARQAASDSAQAVERDFVQALVREGLYGPMPTEAELPGGPGPVDLQAVRRQLYNRQRMWEGAVTDAARAHLRAGDDELDAPANSPLDERSLRDEHASALRRRPFVNYQEAAPESLARWQDDDARYARLRELAVEYARERREGFARTQAEVDRAQEAERRAFDALFGEPYNWGAMANTRPASAPRWADYSSARAGTGDLSMAEQVGYREFVVTTPPSSRIGQGMEPGYQHGHWAGLQNPLLHVRTTVRSLPDGRRVLYVEEIQTDLHQAAREPQKDPRTGRDRLDAEGRPIPTGYRPWGSTPRDMDDPRVQTRLPLWQARDVAWEAFRRAQQALRDWQTRPRPGVYDRTGTPMSGETLRMRHPGVTYWDDQFLHLASEEATVRRTREATDLERRSRELASSGGDPDEAQRLHQQADRLRLQVRRIDDQTPEDEQRAFDRMRDLASQHDRANAGAGREPALEAEQLPPGDAQAAYAGIGPDRRYIPGTGSLGLWLQLRGEREAITRQQADARDGLQQAQHALQRGSGGDVRTPDDLRADVFIQEQAIARESQAARDAQASLDHARADWVQRSGLDDDPRFSREANRDPAIRQATDALNDARARLGSEQQLLDDMRRAAPDQNAPPEAPFQDTWVQVALKRMLVVASDEGLDGVGVISGENAVHHVDAAQEIRELVYSPENADLTVVDAQGNTHHYDVTSERELREAVGGTLADQLIARADADTARVDADRQQADDEAYDRAREDFFDRDPDVTDEDWEDYSNRYGPWEGDYDSVDPPEGRMDQAEIGQGQWAGNRNLVDWYNTAVRNAAQRLANRLGVQAEVSEVIAPESRAAVPSRDLQGNPTQVETDVLVIPLAEAQRQRLREEGLPLFLKRQPPTPEPSEAPGRDGVVGRDGAVALAGRVRPPDLTDLAGAGLGAYTGQEEERRRIEAERALGQDVGLGEEALRRGGMGLLGAAGGVGIVRGGLRRGGPAGLIDLDGLPRGRGAGSAAAERVEPLGRPTALEMPLADRERRGLTGPEARPTDRFGRPYPPGETLASQGGRPQENTVLRQVDDAFRQASDRARAEGRALRPEDVDLSAIAVPPGSHPTGVAELVAQTRAGQADRYWYERMGEILDDATGPAPDPLIRDELGATFANWGQQSLPLDNTRMALVSGLARAQIQASHPEVWDWLMTAHVITEAEVGRGGPGLHDASLNPRAWLYEYLFNRAGTVIDPTNPTGPGIPVAQASWAQPYGIVGMMGPGQILGRQLALWRHGEANIPGGPKLSIYQGETADAPRARATSLSTPDRHEFARYGLVGNDLAGEGGASQYVLAMNEAIARHFFPGWASKHVQAAGWSEYRRHLPRMTPADLLAGDPAHIRSTLARLIDDYRAAVQSGHLTPLLPHDPASLEGVVSRGDPFAPRPPKGPRARIPDPFTGMQVENLVDAPTRAESQASTAAASPQIHLQNLTPQQADALVPPGGSGQVEPLRQASIPHHTVRTGDHIRVALTNADDAGIDDALARLHRAGLIPPAPVAVVRPNLDPQAPITGVRLEHPQGRPWTLAEGRRAVGPEADDALVVDGGRALVWPDADDALADRLQQNLKNAGYSDDLLTGFADAVERRTPGAPVPAGAAGPAPGAPGGRADAAAGRGAPGGPAGGRGPGGASGAPGASPEAGGAPAGRGPRRAGPGADVVGEPGDVSASARLVEPGPGATPSPRLRLSGPGQRAAGRRRAAGAGAGEPAPDVGGAERPAGEPGPAPGAGGELGSAAPAAPPPPGPERPIAQLAKVGQGKAGMGINKERLRDVLGGNMYSGDLAKVAVKELLQNAVDSVRPKQGGAIRVDVNADARTLRITDQGLGMSRATLEGPFLDIAGSEKPEGASGGFGLAKIAYLSKAENMHVETVWRNPDTGRYFHATLDGSGDDWVNENLDVTSRAVSRAEAEALAQQHGWEGSLTGADVRIHFTDDARFSGWEANEFLKNWARNTLLPFDFAFTSRGSPILGEYDVETGDYKPLFRTDTERPPLVTTVPFRGGRFDVYLSPETARTGYPSIQVLNNGQPQFIHRFFLQEDQPMPKEIIVDVKSADDPTLPDYPFQTNRESLRDDAKKALEDYIKDTLGQDLIQAENATYRQAIRTAPKIPGSPYTIVNSSGYPQNVVDEIVAGALNPNVGAVNRGKTPASMTPAEKREATRGQRAALKALTDGFRAVQTALAEAYPRGNYRNAEFTGWGLGKEYYAVNVTTEHFLGTGSPRHILINPYNLIRDTARDLEAELSAQGLDRWSLPYDPAERGGWDYRLAQRLAAHMAADLIHELTHNEHGPHDATYASLQTRNTGQANEALGPVIKKLRTILLENGSELLRQLQAEQAALESGGAGRTEDLFSKIGSERGAAGRAGAGRAGIEGPDGRPGGLAGGALGGRRPGDPAGVGRGPGDGGPGAAAGGPGGAAGAADRGPERGLGRGGPLPALPGEAPGGLEPGPGLGGSRPGREPPIVSLRAAAGDGALGGDGLAGGLTLRQGGAGAGAAGSGAGAAGSGGSGAGAGGAPGGASGGAAPGGSGGQSRAQAVYQGFVSWAKLAQLFSARGLLRQALGNVAGLPWQVAERTLAAGLAGVTERPVRALLGKDTSMLPTFSEAGALAGSYLRPSTWREAGKAAAAGPSPRLQQAMGAPTAPQGKIERANALGYHVLGVFDRFARSLAESAERHAQTARGGVSQADVDARVAAAGDYRTLTQDLDTVGQAIDGLRKIPGGELVIPYWQIPYNGMKYDLERSPLGLAHTTATSLKDALTGQGRGGVSATEQYERFARGILGTGVAWWMWQLAMDDRISGPEPESDVEKDAWKAQGKVPFALKWGTRWLPLSQLPGINAPLIQAAAVADFVKRRETEGRTEWDGDAYGRLVNRAVTTTIHAVATKPFFDGLQRLLEVTSENDESGERGLVGAGMDIASGFLVPGAIRDIERATSDVERAPRDWQERVIGNLPGLSGMVPERRDAFGNVRRRTGSGIERYLNPMPGTEATPDNWEPRYQGSASPMEDTAVARAKTTAQRQEAARAARADVPPEDRPSAEQTRLARRAEREPWVRHRRAERQRKLRESGEPKVTIPGAISRAAGLVGR